MFPRLRPVALLLLAAIAALVVAACGNADKEAATTTDANALLRETFTGKKKIDSGLLDLSARVDVQGGGSQAQGPFEFRLTGPFETQGAKQLPKFKLDLTFAGADQRFQAGATSTGDKGFVSFQNQQYVLAPDLFRQFKAGFEQAQQDAAGKRGNQPSLATLGVDPRRWLSDARTAGEAKVGDADTIKITGRVDVRRLLDDVDRALARARSLGVQGAGDLPTRLTNAQRRQVTDAVKDVRVQVFTGKQDTVLRRLVVALDLKAPRGSRSEFRSAKLALDFKLTELNSSQDISEPSGARPFEDLLKQFGGLGLGLGLGGSASGGGATGGGASGGGANGAALERYAQCVRKAGKDAAATRRCADLLTP